jgi:hypothetical protein
MLAYNGSAEERKKVQKTEIPEENPRGCIAKTNHNTRLSIQALHHVCVWGAVAIVLSFLMLLFCVYG